MDLITESKRPYFDKLAAMAISNIKLEDLDDETTPAVVALIKRNLGAFEEVGSVLASAFRRVDRMQDSYSLPGARYLVARDSESSRVIGGAGIGPLAGLPATEGIGEIRELVLDESYRGKGIGRQLLKRCLELAREFGYQRIYLETTPQMSHAQALFQKFGFRAVTHAPGAKAPSEEKNAIPTYFLLENLVEALDH